MSLIVVAEKMKSAARKELLASRRGLTRRRAHAKRAEATTSPARQKIRLAAEGAVARPNASVSGLILRQGAVTLYISNVEALADNDSSEFFHLVVVWFGCVLNSEGWSICRAVIAVRSIFLIEHWVNVKLQQVVEAQWLVVLSLLQVDVIVEDLKPEWLSILHLDLRLSLHLDGLDWHQRVNAVVLLGDAVKVASSHLVAGLVVLIVVGQHVEDLQFELVDIKWQNLTSVTTLLNDAHRVEVREEDPHFRVEHRPIELVQDTW
jgi:hypothetical protein